MRNSGISAEKGRSRGSGSSLRHHSRETNVSASRVCDESRADIKHVTMMAGSPYAALVATAGEESEEMVPNLNPETAPRALVWNGGARSVFPAAEPPSGYCPFVVAPGLRNTTQTGGTARGRQGAIAERSR
jgi:hypothetical protein